MTGRTREEKYRLMLAHRAAAGALEASLKDEAAAEYEQHRARVSWDWTDMGSVVASLNHNAVVVTDPDAFMEWMKVNAPHQVQPVTTWTFINPDWVNKVLLPSLEPVAIADDDPEPAEAKPGDRLPVLDMGEGGGVVVPGVRWVKGGGLRSVSVKPDPAVTRRLNLAAAAYADGAGPMPGITSGGETDG